jgi:hypothetical protein
LSKARSTDPRRFGNPTSTLVVLREIGITVAQDAAHRTPGRKDMTRSRQSRANVAACVTTASSPGYAYPPLLAAAYCAAPSLFRSTP